MSDAVNRLFRLTQFTGATKSSRRGDEVTLEDFLTVGSAGGSPGGSTSAPSSLISASTSSPPDAVASLLLNIPLAYEGQVIGSDHHNKMLFALVAIAEQMGIKPGARTGTRTFTPFFRKHEDTAEWPTVGGIAIVEAGDAAGWMPVDLPNGASIQRVTVNGRRSGTISGPFEVTLLRVSIADAGKTPLIHVVLDTDGQFATVGTTLASGADTVREALTVDTTNYTYVIVAKVSKVAEAATAQINAIQITYS